MTGPWPVMPGVPAAGHVDRGGSWHPGSPATCHKGRCGYDKEQAERHRERELAERERERERERDGDQP